MAVLLLQGPLGPFFRHFKVALEDEGVITHRIVFNGGDEVFSGLNSVAFSGSLNQWSSFFLEYVRKNNIKTVIAYGDCRDYHIGAKRACLHEGIRYFALEEGYLRPNYITLEEGGVNGHSPITRDAISSYEPIHSAKNEIKIEANFFKRAWFASVYYIVSTLYFFKFRRYQHHRVLNPVYEAFWWVRGAFRKYVYKFFEPSVGKLVQQGDYFLVPLQVHNDAQIEYHSHYNKIEDFIVEALKSFSESGFEGRVIFKHHPMDRGHTNYKRFIKSEAAKLDVVERVDYIHDQHLPKLLKYCNGVVTINSTTALQAFYHRAPVKVLGDAFFDMDGLTCQKRLIDFWCDPGVSNEKFNDQFKAYLLDHGQINGSFYCQFDMTIKNLIAHLKSLDVI